MIYRLYTPEDFAQLYAIEEICFQPPFRFGRSYMRQLVKRVNAATWVAQEDALLAGFAIVEWTQEIGGVLAYIQTIEVVPAQRGRGVGGELLRHIEISARSAGAESLWLHVDAANAGAINIYEAHGYVIQGREEDYYSPGRPAAIYAKPLGD